MGEVPSWAADLPDSLVGLSPDLFQVLYGELAHFPAVVERGEAAFVGAVEDVGDLAEESSWNWPEAALPVRNGLAIRN